MSARSLDHLLQALQLTAGSFDLNEPADDWQPVSAGTWPSLLVVVLAGRLALDCPFTGQHVLGAGSLAALRCPRPMIRNASSADEAPTRLVFGGIAPLLADGNPWITEDGALIKTAIGGSDLLRTVEGELLDESRSSAPGAGVVVDCIVKRLFTTLMRDQVVLPARDPRTLRLARAAEFMRASLAHAHSMEELAERAGMSRTAFHQGFSQLYGMSPFGYLTRLRMAQAQTLLTSTDRSVKAIGLDLGYKSRSSFWAAFKTAFGVDPTAFRTARRLTPP
ncbi:helix-turn-helix domain-containing protein [Roseateles chitinivorans]|uniref:helix-turn-helix domain-containing protein n=1 Tax=Roseateles chitinivorans TaxID=2917965 RepID=UPI003D671764